MPLAPPSRARALTLVELLVVIALVSLLAALTLFAISAARARADETRCASSLRSIGHAFDLYAADYQAWPVTTAYVGGDGNSRSWEWLDLVSPYLGPHLNPDGLAHRNIAQLPVGASPLRGCPRMVDLPRRALGYGMNPYFAAAPDLGTNEWGPVKTKSGFVTVMALATYPPGVWPRPNQWTFPAEKALVCDAVDDTLMSRPWPWWEPKTNPMPAAPAYDSFPVDYTRHAGRARPTPTRPSLNMLFADLHVEKVSPQSAHHAITFQSAYPR